MLTLNNEDQKWVDAVWERLDRKMSAAAVSAREKIPYSTAGGKYDDLGKEPIIYGDYYFTKAIYKLKGFEPLFW